MKLGVDGVAEWRWQVMPALHLTVRERVILSLATILALETKGWGPNKCTPFWPRAPG